MNRTELAISDISRELDSKEFESFEREVEQMLNNKHHAHEEKSARKLPVTKFLRCSIEILI